MDRMHQGLERGEKILLEERVRFVELENKKLHDRLLNYQMTMEELEKTHIELVNMVKMQRRK